MSDSNYEVMFGRETKSSEGNESLWMFGVLIVVLLALFVFVQNNEKQSVNPTPPPGPVIDDDQRQDDGKREERPDAIKGGYLVVVDETQGRSIEHVKTLQDFAFWHEEIQTLGLAGFNAMDDDLEEARVFLGDAKDLGIDTSSGVVLLYSSAGAPVGGIPFPSTGDVEPIRELIKKYGR